jgi:hypothetical protein
MSLFVFLGASWNGQIALVLTPSKKDRPRNLSVFKFNQTFSIRINWILTAVGSRCLERASEWREGFSVAGPGQAIEDRQNKEHELGYALVAFMISATCTPRGQIAAIIATRHHLNLPSTVHLFLS